MIQLGALIRQQQRWGSTTPFQVRQPREGASAPSARFLELQHEIIGLTDGDVLGAIFVSLR
jgi:hypothetical protein